MHVIILICACSVRVFSANALVPVLYLSVLFTEKDARKETFFEFFEV